MNPKAYNPEWSFNQEVRRRARRWLKTNLLTEAQAKAIVQAYPLDFYQPNFFIKVGLFLFTWFGCFMAGGLFLLMFGSGLADTRVVTFESVLLVDSLLMGAVTIVALDAFIRNSRLYHSGSDNALLYFALGSFLTALGLFYDHILGLPIFDDVLIGRGLFWLLLVPVVALLFAAVVRYADALVAAACYLTILLMVATFALQLALGKVVLPFVLMLVSGAAYVVLQRLKRRPDYLYYRTCIKLTSALALVTAYLGGNYLVVREANAALNNLPTSVQIAFAPLFYFFTAGIPVAYVVLGLRKHNRILLYVGLLTFAFSLYTVRHYRSVLPVEAALTLGGAALVLLTAICLRYLRKPKHGFTAAPIQEADPLNLEALVTVQINKPAAPAEPAFAFGGGHSGGGGATGSY
ncbi:hypothetical protein [Solirubrum puertoriconensis]|uniref:Uncharacterized protein n=1 Tax=Solirubrum puertoriconensis TaxID=1751427 RepID=A0A9X0HM57_SOLP1|nr:hypothetical protein [Solirubrum puertoriconensis]KUG08525.1 hypothetical protein ASU33_10205 [Solirubrum puertoriconensis]